MDEVAALEYELEQAQGTKPGGQTVDPGRIVAIRAALKRAKRLAGRGETADAEEPTPVESRRKRETVVAGDDLETA